MWIWVQRAAIASLIVFAAYVRVDGLSEPNYWYDEAITSLRVAGHTEREVAQFAAEHPSFRFGDLRQFVEVDSRTGIADTVRSLAREDPQHTPLYYVAARLWAMLFGSSVEAGRALAALLSILALAAMYWLCSELFVKTGSFPSPAICWVGVLVMALSPYQVAFAREHREYSLFVLTLTLGCAAFLRALRTNDTRAWILYGAAMTVALYTHLVTLAAVAALGVFLLVRERFRFTGVVWRFAAASLAAGLLCLPWFFVLMEQRNVAESSLGWTANLSRTRYDLHVALTPALGVADYSLWDLKGTLARLPGYRFTYRIAPYAPLFMLAALAALVRGSRKTGVGFALALIVSVSGTLFVTDFLTGRTAGWAYRYAVPTNLGWLLALTLLLATLAYSRSRWAMLGHLAVAGYLVVGINAALVTHDAKHTMAKAWDKTGEAEDFLNSRVRVSVVSDDFVGAVLAIARRVQPDLPLSWRPRCFSCERSIRPVLDIPFPGGDGEIAYFRSWINMPLADLDQLFARGPEAALQDARFGVNVAPLPSSHNSLFLLWPK